MATIIQLGQQKAHKPVFKKVKRRNRKAQRLEAMGQLNLFAKGPRTSLVVEMTHGLTPFEQALMLDEKGDPAAQQKYRDAIQKGDALADSYCNLGILESRFGSKENAFDCFTKGLVHDSRHFECHYNLANLYFDLGDHDLAITHYRFANKIDPSYLNLYYNLGLVLAVQEDYRESVEHLLHFKKHARQKEARQANELIDKIEELSNPKRARLRKV